MCMDGVNGSGIVPVAVFNGKSAGLSPKFNLNRFGDALALPWNCSETALKMSRTLVPYCSRNTPWKQPRTTLKRAWRNQSNALWNCSETALKLLRNCSDIGDYCMKIEWKEVGQFQVALIWRPRGKRLKRYLIKHRLITFKIDLFIFTFLKN